MALTYCIACMCSEEQLYSKGPEISIAVIGATTVYLRVGICRNSVMEMAVKMVMMTEMEMEMEMARLQ